MFELLLLLFFLHWFGDFVCQTRWMADNKSKNPAALTFHVLIYTVVMGIGLSPWVVYYGGVPESFAYFLIVNFVLHWLTDISTSQVTKYFWAKKDIHKFFATIGFDQFIHQVCLLVTARIFLI